MTIRFGTDGWRAVMADEFTNANVALVTAAIARYLKEVGSADRGVVVAYDSRFLSEQFAQVARSQLLRQGIMVLSIDQPSATPIVAHAVTQMRAAGAIMLTASHNPPEYQGLKFIADYGGPAFPEITERIEEQLHAARHERDVAGVAPHAQESVLEPFSAYGSHIRQLLGCPSFAGLNVVVDPMHGSGGTFLKALLEECGANVKLIRSNRDAFFGGGLPEPTRERLSLLSQAVRETEAALGLALDGDGDRFGIIDERGVFHTPNHVLSLLYSYFLDHRSLRGAVARTVVTTHLLDRIASRHREAVHETPVGFKYIARHLMNDGILLGGEESGGLSIRGHVPEKDGILACLLVTQMVADLRQHLSFLLDSLFQTYGHLRSARRDVPFAPLQRQKLVERLVDDPLERLGSYSVTEVRRMDGLEVRFGADAWCVVRLSGTEDVARVYVEAAEEREVDDILGVVVRHFFSD